MITLKIGTFLLPQEVDMYEQTLIQLKMNSYRLKDMKVILDATLCLSNTLTDWSTSKIPIEYFEHKFRSFARLADWCEFRPTIECGDNVLGVNDQHRNMIEMENTGIDAYMWLDSDIIFPSNLLSTLEQSITHIIDSGLTHYVITPQYVRQWDATWDVVTNDRYLNDVLKSNFECDSYKMIYDQQLNILSLLPISEFKFGAGWCTVISRHLLHQIGVPNELGHYGNEDTNLMYCVMALNRNGQRVHQFIMRGLIVCENWKYRDTSHYTNFITSINRQDEYRKIAQQNLNLVVNNFIEREQLS